MVVNVYVDTIQDLFVELVNKFLYFKYKNLYEFPRRDSNPGRSGESRVS